MLRLTSLLVLSLIASAAAAQAPPGGWPAPGDGFDWQAVGDIPVKASHLAFDDTGRLWGASSSLPGNSTRLPDPEDSDGQWVISGNLRNASRVMALGRGDTVLVGSALVHRTVDGGQTWNSMPPSCGAINVLTAVPTGTPPGPWGDLSGVLLAGDQGLCRSDDRGATWTEVPLTDPPPFTTFMHDALVLPAGHPHAGRVVAATSDGVWLSDAAAPTLTLRRGTGLAPQECERLLLLPSGRLLLTGYNPGRGSRFAYVSDDGGEGWRETQALPEPADGISGDAWPAVIGGQTAVTIGARGVVYRTEDDGETWGVVGRVPITDNSLTSRHVVVGPQGRLYVAVMRAGNQTTDAWVWRTALPQVVSDEVAPETGSAVGVRVSPNPARAGTVAVGVALPAASLDVRVEIYDAAGRRVAVLHQGAAVGTLDLDLDTSGFAAGVYRVVVTSGGERVSAAFTVAR